MTRWSIRFIAIALLLVACTNEPKQAAKTFTIAVIPQGSTHEFWKSIHAGAMKSAGDYRAQGINVDGIVLAPFDKNALVRPVEEAKRAGIPTVVIDSALESNDPISFVASNNHHGGELAA